MTRSDLIPHEQQYAESKGVNLTSPLVVWNLISVKQTSKFKNPITAFSQASALFSEEIDAFMMWIFNRAGIRFHQSSVKFHPMTANYISPPLRLHPGNCVEMRHFPCIPIWRGRYSLQKIRAISNFRIKWLKRQNEDPKNNYQGS